MATLPALQTPNTEIVPYTATELLKIQISGAMLVIAVLLITYMLYKYISNRRENWERVKRQEEMDESGIPYNPEDYYPVPYSVNKKLIYGFALLIIIVGLLLTVVL